MHLDIRHFAGLHRFSGERWPLAAGPLEIGLSRPLLVREERLSTHHDACRLLYVSDIHLRSGRSAVLSGQVCDAVAGCRPDVVLLGGDLVDSRSELRSLERLTRAIKAPAARGSPT